MRERRRLSSEERALLAQQLNRNRRVLGFWKFGVWAVASVAAVGLVAWLVLSPRGETPATVAAFVGLLMMIAGVVGALVEVAVGSNRFSRAVFGGTAVMVAVGFAANLERGWLYVAMTASFCFVIFGGLVALILRWRNSRKIRKAMPAVEADLRGGEVHVFRGLGMLMDYPRVLQRIHIAPENGEETLALLPSSGIVIELNGIAVRQWVKLEIAQVAAVNTDALTAPLFGVALEGIEVDHQYRQRHMSPAEVEEINRHRKLLLRRSIVAFPVVTCLSAIVARVVENLILGQLQSTLSIGGWCLAIAVGGYFAIRWLRLRWWLGMEAKARKIVVMRDCSAPTGTPTIAEVLPIAQMVWSVDGVQAGWRMRKW